jgi:thioredoxin-like negative regulator of GroEL
VRVGKLNVEENDQVPFQYGITAMPTLLVFKGGKVAEQRVGKMSRDQLAKLLDEPPVASEGSDLTRRPWRLAAPPAWDR